MSTTISTRLPSAHTHRYFGAHDEGVRLAVSILTVAVLCSQIACRGSALRDRGPGGNESTSQIARSDTLLPDSVELRAEAPAVATSGDSVVFLLSIRNRSHSQRRFEIGWPDAVNFIVRDSTGALVWSAFAEKRILVGQDLLLQLPPGGAREFSVGWAQRDTSGIRARAGRYEVVAEVQCCRPPILMRPFRISIR